MADSTTRQGLDEYHRRIRPCSIYSLPIANRHPSPIIRLPVPMTEKEFDRVKQWLDLVHDAIVFESPLTIDMEDLP